MTINQMITMVLLVAAAAAAIAHFVFHRREDGRAVALKPLPLVLLLIAVIIVPQPVAPFYKAAVLLGLLLSLLAEALLLAKSPVVVSLTLGALAQFVYFAGTAGQTTFRLSTLWGLLLVLLAAAGLYRVWHRARLEREPVIALVAGLTLFAWAALGFLRQTESVPSMLALAGAALFALAISALGWATYRRDFRFSYETTWGLYLVAQLLVALSTRGDFGF